MASILVSKYGDNEAMYVQVKSAEEFGIAKYNRFDLFGAEKYTKAAVSLFMTLYKKTQWIGTRRDVERCTKNLFRIQSEIKRIKE